MWTLTWLLNQDSQHATFADAFREMYRKFHDEKVLTKQSLESIWILPPEPKNTLPIMFWAAIEKAHDEGVLTKDGKLAS